MTKPIAISLSPNTDNKDFVLAVDTLFSPWTWFSRKFVRQLEKKFDSYFGSDYSSIAVNSGRSAEYVILEALGVGVGDEVIVQAFTCIAVPNSVIWLGAKPIYVDVDDSYNMDPIKLKKKITKRTKAIIIQHTFGVPVQIEKISKIAQKHNVYLIEDCAHSLGATHEGKKVGTFSTASFFSFGRDKVISSVFGGMIITKDKKLYKKMSSFVEQLPMPLYFWTKQQLLHPIVFHMFVLPYYHIGMGKVSIGKLILFVFQKLHLLSKPVYKRELATGQIDLFPRKMPDALARLALRQFDKLTTLISHRQKIADYYQKELKDMKLVLPKPNRGAVWLRFPIRVKNSKDLIAFAKKNKILLGDWYANVIDPKCDIVKAGYVRGNCKAADTYASEIVNLPTNPNLSMDQVSKVVEIIKKWDMK